MVSYFSKTCYSKLTFWAESVTSFTVLSKATLPFDSISKAFSINYLRESVERCFNKVGSVASFLGHAITTFRHPFHLGHAIASNFIFWTLNFLTSPLLTYKRRSKKVLFEFCVQSHSIGKRTLSGAAKGVFL